MTNTWSNMNAEGWTPDVLSKMEQIKGGLIWNVLESSRAKFLTLLAAASLAGNVAVADEANQDKNALLASMDTPVAETVTDGSYQVAAMLPIAWQEMPDLTSWSIEVLDDSAWFNNLDLSNPIIAEFLLPRFDDMSFEFVRNHLKDFAQLSHEMQDYLVQASHWVGWYTDEHWNIVEPLEPEDTQLLSYLRVPLALRTAIDNHLMESLAIDQDRVLELSPLIEAERLSRSKTRDLSEWEVAYVRIHRMLNKLEKSGDLSMRELAFIEESIGDLYHAIPQVVDLRIAREWRLAAEARADASEARAAETTAERLAVEERAAETTAERLAAEEWADAAEEWARLALLVESAVLRARNTITN
jgi:hypothetical protein